MKIIDNILQGTHEWQQIRCGVATSSRFSEIMTVKQLKASTNAYIYELCAERITGQYQEIPQTQAMRRGELLENHARDYYAFKKGIEVKQVAFIMSDCGRYGASPDAITLDHSGGIEAKCPGLKKHLEYLDKNTLPCEHSAQVYGNLFVSGFDYWDFISYHPNAPDLLVTVEKTDDTYKKWAEAFKPVLANFLDRLDKLHETVSQAA